MKSQPDDRALRNQNRASVYSGGHTRTHGKLLPMERPSWLARLLGRVR